jgi:uncharacterized protein (DUF433 family)
VAAALASRGAVGRPWYRWGGRTGSDDGMAGTTDIGALIAASPAIRGGRARIAGTGVTVLRVAGWYRQGLRAGQIAAEVPHLSLAQVYAAPAYYHANREEFDRRLAEDAAEAAAAEARLDGARPDGQAGPLASRCSR